VTDQVRVALIGAGRIARVHAEAYRTVAGGRLTTCMDPVESAAASLAADFGLRVAPDLDSVLGDPQIEAVVIASPNAAHADQTIAALAAGKHVFCQKPIALTLEDADRVLAAARNSDRTVQFGFMLRFTPPVPDIAARVRAGELGRIVAARASIFGWEPTGDWFYDPAQGGGVILDTLIHFADLVLWMFGPADRVHTEGGAYVLDEARRLKSPDNATVTIRHASGVVSDLYVTWTAGRGNFVFEIYGATGSAVVDLVQGQASKIFLKQANSNDPRPRGWSFPDLVWAFGYRGEQQHFVDRILGLESHSLATSPVEARAALQLLLAAQRSLDEQRIVELP
jgi:myo-inositol 2-dehydrogenase/D-chiro-inositol 1-dehydrogenase